MRRWPSAEFTLGAFSHAMGEHEKIIGRIGTLIEKGASKCKTCLTVFATSSPAFPNKFPLFNDCRAVYHARERSP
jgi:hypothetical protein